MSAAMEGHPAVDVNSDGSFARIAVTSAVFYAPITDTEAVPRRPVVDIRKCDDCHNQLSLHGNNRTDKPEVCVTCHNPMMTDVNQRGADPCLSDLGADDQTIDFKHMIHRIHASGEIGIPYEVCGFRSSVHSFDITYPGRVNNCEGCHLADTYYPIDSPQVFGTTFDVNDPAILTDDRVVSPNVSVCSACHQETLDTEHMQQNGGDFSATKAADGSLVSAGVETCAVCHGPGRIADVKVMHGVDAFEFN
jgi:OmcA/MtrC family decaheme c-type cytochrome